MIAEDSPREATSRWDALMYSFPDRWDRPWNTFAFLILSALLWAIYSSSNTGPRIELYTVISAVVTVGALSDLYCTIRVPTELRLLGDIVEAERLFLPRIAWSTNDMEVRERAGGLVIINWRSPEKSRLKDTIVLPADYPRLDQIREILLPCPPQYVNPTDSEGSTLAESEDSGGNEE